MYERTDETEAAIELMKYNMQFQNDPLVGIFWYSVHGNELFGVTSSLAESNNWYISSQFHTKIRTDMRLHQDIWKKQFFRGKDSRFKGNYMYVPRGRVFEFEGEGFKIYTGKWIDNYPQVKDLIIEEFQLPKDNVEFKQDYHWNIGHGWVNEF